MKALASFVRNTEDGAPFGWREIHVLAWNYDGKGTAFCVIADDDQAGYLTQAYYGADLDTLLLGHPDGVMPYVLAEPFDVPLRSVAQLPFPYDEERRNRKAT